jgi:hypothetical protein
MSGWQVADVPGCHFHWASHSVNFEPSPASARSTAPWLPKAGEPDIDSWAATASAVTNDVTPHRRHIVDLIISHPDGMAALQAKTAGWQRIGTALVDVCRLRLELLANYVRNRQRRQIVLVRWAQALAPVFHG